MGRRLATFVRRLVALSDDTGEMAVLKAARFITQQRDGLQRTWNSSPVHSYACERRGLIPGRVINAAIRIGLRVVGSEKDRRT